MSLRTLVGCAVLVLCASLARGQTEQAPGSTQPDGDSTVLPMPFEPSGFHLLRSSEQILIWGDAYAPEVATKFLIVDLAKPSITKQQAIPARSTVTASDAYICAYAKESQTLRALTTPDLTHVGARQLKADPTKLVVIGDKFIEAQRQGRWSLPDLEPTADEWAFSAGASAFAAGDSWFVDGFLFDQQLSKPTRFCGHRAIFVSDVAWMDHGTPKPVSGSRLAPFLKSFGTTYPPYHRSWQFQVAAPIAMPLQPGLFEPDSASPAASKMHRWVRLQIVTPVKQAGNIANERLLGKIRAELPESVTSDDLFRRRGSLTLIATDGRRCVAVLAKHLLIFTLSDACLEKLPQPPRIVASEFPTVVPAEKTKWPLKVADGREIKHVELLSRNSLRYDAETQSIEIDPLRAREYNDAKYQQPRRRFSARTTLDEWGSQIRDQNTTLCRRIEALHQDKLQGLPMAVSFRLKVTCEDGGEAHLGGAVVVDLPLELFRAQFEKRQAERLARLQQPPSPVTTESKLPDLSPAQEAKPTEESVDEAAKAVAVSENDSLASAAATSEPAENDEPIAEAVSPETLAQVLFEVGFNIALSTLFGGSCLWLGCRLRRAGLPPEESFAPPRLGRLFMVMLVLSVLFAGVESFFVVWGRGAVEVDGFSWLLVGGLFFVVAGFIRFVATTISVPVLLRLSIDDMGEVMVFFWLLAFVPYAALLGAWFAITLT
jgi:hypothetical protein